MEPLLGDVLVILSLFNSFFGCWCQMLREAILEYQILRELETFLSPPLSHLLHWPWKKRRYHTCTLLVRLTKIWKFISYIYPSAAFSYLNIMIMTRLAIISFCLNCCRSACADYILQADLLFQVFLYLNRFVYMY